MEIIQSHSHRKSSPNDVVATLPLYRSAPPLQVRLEDFELFAMDRLRGISDGLSRGKETRRWKNWEDLRKWFLSMETALFHYHFRLESAEAQV
ncbi:hypothetical protein L6164_010762 [Bauhinia variegata]|uniref:Uncharacterized protein n=1 Tax=Bauhinia variegata TaxID=167791 RepID=A0ACB9P5S8_BAUVA|nr:hypothetical protein L6164_010762 [Bauhinia variegata]